jgi:hypothetical protein
MTTEQLRKALEKVPFRPFMLHLADGDIIPVPAPHHVAYAPGARTIGVAYLDGTLDVVDLLLVTKLAFRKSTGRRRGQNGNGSPNK